MRFFQPLSSLGIRWITRSHLLKSQQSSLQERPFRSKARVLLKDAYTLLGLVTALDLSGDRFKILPPDGHGDEQVVFYDDVIAVKLVQNFDSQWRNGFRSSRKTTGCWVAVTLLTGEVIEGISLEKLNSGSKRFFLLSPDDNGTPLWTMVEMSGTAGIMTNEFAKGIYSKEFIPLLEPRDLLSDTPVRKHRLEERADFLFSLHDFQSALAVYERLYAGSAQSEQILLKVSTCHYNLGVKQLSLNQYTAAKNEFALAAATPFLYWNAVARAEAIERMLHLGERVGTTISLAVHEDHRNPAFTIH